jgi:hypothetical protein
VDDKEIEELIKRHQKATHSLDMDAFMETLADDAEVTFLLTKNVVKGKELLRPFFQKNLFDPVTELKTELTQKVQFRNYRTYVERVTECSNPDFVGLEYHWTIEFEEGKIKRIWTLQ